MSNENIIQSLVEDSFMAFESSRHTLYPKKGSFAQLLDLQRLLGWQGQFRIPKNQRMYSWGKKEILQLIKDLEDNKRTHTRSKKDMFSLGTIDVKITRKNVPQDRGNGVSRVPIYDVYDGQQRLTSCMLISLACADVYSKYDKGAALKKRQIDIFRGGNSLLFFDYKELNTAFESLCNNGNLSAYTHTNKPTGVYQMEITYNTIKTYLTGKKKKEIEKFHNHMLKFTEIVLLNSLANGHVMFETRNNRGITPNQLDLTKNFIEYIDSKHKLSLKFGGGDWRNAMNLRDSSFLNNMHDKKNVDQVNRGENALLGRVQTVTTGVYLGQGKYETFYKRFKPLIEKKNPTLLIELNDFIKAFNDMSDAMANVLSPEEGWVTYGTLEKWKPSGGGVPLQQFNEQRGLSLALFADIFSRLDIEATWQVVVLALYHKLDKIEDFNRCLMQIEKAAFRIYRFRGQSRNDFARNELSKLAMQIYKWPSADQSGVICFTLNAIGYICVSKAGSTLSSMFTELTTIGKNHYRTKWSLYLLYHYEVSLYPKLMLGSVTKNWNYSKTMPTGTGTNDIVFEREHIMPKNLFPDSGGIRTGEVPQWLESNGNKAFEDGSQSYWINKWNTAKNEAPWFQYDYSDNTTKKRCFDDYDGFRHSIGNLVMSKGELNSKYSNHPYVRMKGYDEKLGKRKQYLKYRDFRRVKNISRIYTDWNKRTIYDRAQRIARWAVRRFKLENCTNPGEYPKGITRTVRCLFGKHGDKLLKPFTGEEMHDLEELAYIPEHSNAFRKKSQSEADGDDSSLGKAITEDIDENEALDSEEPLDVEQPSVEKKTHVLLPQDLEKQFDFPEDYYNPDLKYKEKEKHWTE